MFSRSGPKTWSFLTSNITTWSSFERIQESSLRFDVIGVQETHLKPEQCDSHEAQLRKVGYNAILSPGAPKGTGGLAGGLATMVSSNIGLSGVLGHEPVIWPGRATALHVGGVCRGGVVFVNMYLKHSSGLGAFNWGILSKVGSFLKQVGLPFVIAADWQIEPDCIVTSGWPAALDATVFFPDRGTCRPANKVIDYFVVSNALARVCVCKVLADIPTAPHFPVLLTFSAIPAEETIQVVQVPRRFPAALPTGCALPPHPDRWDEIAMQVEDQEVVNDKWNVYVRACEDEWMGIFQIQPEDVHKYSGRSSVLRLTEQPIRRPGPPRFPKLSTIAVWWRKVTVSSEELLVPNKILVWRDAVRRLGKLSRSHFLPNDELYLAWSRCLARARSFPDPVVHVLIQWARAAAESEANRAAKHKEIEWNKWVENHSHNGSSALYAYSALPTPWQPSCMDHCTVRPATSREQMKAMQAEWEGWWQVSHHHPDLVWPDDLGVPPPPPSVAELRAVLKTFKASTGTGFDQCSPRLFLLLPDEALSILCDIIGAIERNLEWPSAWIRIVFILKRAGGVRPLGLLHVLCRVQSRLRRPLVHSWQHENFQSFWWSVKGRSSEKCVWISSAWSEYSTARDMSTATVLLDLKKAFELVRHHHLIQAAIESNFPLWILKLLISMYRMPRVLDMQGVASDVIRAEQTIVPGCHFATVMLQLLLLGPLRQVQSSFRCVMLSVNVDDFALQRNGTASRVLKEVSGASKMLCRLLKEVDMRLAVDKGRVISNSIALRRALARTLTAVGVQGSPNERNLGVDYAAGRVRGKPVVKARLHMVKARRRRMSTLKSGRPRRKLLGGMARAALEGAVSYGTSVLGVNTGELNQLRSLAGKLQDHHPDGRSRTLALMLSPTKDLDPIFRATWLPIKFLLQCWWEQWIPRRSVEAAVAAAAAHLSKLSVPWNSIRGPFSAAWATMKRVGCDILSMHEWRLPDGVVLDPTVTCASTVERIVHLLCYKWQCKQVAEHLSLPEFHAGVLLQPIISYLRSNASPERRAYVRSCVVGGQWPMHRQWSAGYDVQPFCRVCRDVREVEVMGTLLHRHTACECCEEETTGREPPSILSGLSAAAVSSPLALLLVERCLVPRPELQKPVVTDVPPEFWFLGQPEDLSGDIFIDGSLFEGDWPDLASGGWGAVALAPYTLDRRRARTPTAIVCGPLFAILPTINEAELLAFCFVLRHAMPGSRIHTDSDYVWRGVNVRGRIVCCHVMSSHSVLWCEVWRLLDDRGEDDLFAFVVKTKAHPRPMDFMEGRTTPRLNAGNVLADRFARWAAQAGRLPEAQRDLLNRRVQVLKIWIKWIGCVGEGDDTFHPSQVKRGRPPQPILQLVQDPPLSLPARAVARSNEISEAGGQPHCLVQFTLSQGVVLVGCTTCQALCSDRIASLSVSCKPKRAAWATRIWARLGRGEYKHVGRSEVLQVLDQVAL